MTPENRSIIEHWWNTHDYNDYDWIKLTAPEKCRHERINVKSFDLWFCEDCGAVGRYDELRVK